MQQRDKDQDKSEHTLANIQMENTHTMFCWYGSCVLRALLRKGALSRKSNKHKGQGPRMSNLAQS